MNEFKMAEVPITPEKERGSWVQDIPEEKAEELIDEMQERNEGKQPEGSVL